MEARKILLSVIFVLSISLFLSEGYAEPSVSIKMEKTTYSYCERLTYSIDISEITEETAIVNMKDPIGKSASIPHDITGLQNPIRWEIPITDWWPIGKYHIDVQYSGSEDVTEFVVTDANKECPLEQIRPILREWYDGPLLDIYMLNTIQREISQDIIHIPFETSVGSNTINEIEIPDWVKNVGRWWGHGDITYKDFVQVLNYLIEEKVIFNTAETENEI